MKNYLESLQQRERNLVLIMAGMFAIAIGYFLLYQPLQARLEQAQASLQREVKLLQWIEVNATKLASLRANKGILNPDNSNSLEQIINSSARQFGLTINRFQPQNRKLNLTLEKAKFSAVLQWLGQLQQQNGIIIDSVDFRAELTPGLVRARVLLAK